VTAMRLDVRARPDAHISRPYGVCASGRAPTACAGRLRAMFVVLMLALLGACHQTRFEALPTGAVGDCDAEWVGAWRIEAGTSAGSADEGPVYWLVDADCARYRTMDEHGETEDETEFQIRYLRHEGRRYLVNGKAGLPADAEAWDRAFMLFRYDVRGKDRIELFEIDTQRVARLILDGAIAGRTEVKSSAGRDGRIVVDSTENLIAGPAIATDAVIARKDVFLRRPWMTLHRVGNDEIERRQREFEERSRSPESGRTHPGR
jgi:hypothetical protein